MTTPRTYRYDHASTRRDLAMSGIAIVGCLAPIAAGGVQSPPSLAGLGAVALLFAGFAVHAWRRGRRVVRVCDHEVGLVGRPATRVRWDRLNRLTLRYYATRRDGENGWMQLRLQDTGGHRLSVESHLDGFGVVVARAARAAERRGVPMSPTTQANLSALIDRAEDNRR